MSVPKQGGVLNYLGETQEVNAPRFWQSSPTSPPTELAYITEAEKGLLLDADLHGSLQGSPNKGPSNLLSYDGWGSTDASQNRSGSSISSSMDSNPNDSGWSGESAAKHGESAATQSSGHTEAHLEKATAKNIVDLVDSGVNINDAISGKTSLERMLKSKSPFLTANVLNEILSPFANKANTKRRSNWIEGTDKYGFPRAKDFYKAHGRAYNPNAVLVKGSPEYEFLEDSGYFESLGGDNNNTGGGDGQTFYDNPEDVKLIQDTGANRFDSVAAKWYASLGNNNNNNAFAFSFQKEFDAAKQKQKGILGTSSSVGQLAVSNSPFYNFLKERNLDKGIL
tara:strand:+ start:170 stop:1183 length:1014 start_codon:yes stop_codon:yes gene_type:complete